MPHGFIVWDALNKEVAGYFDLDDRAGAKAAAERIEASRGRDDRHDFRIIRVPLNADRWPVRAA